MFLHTFIIVRRQKEKLIQYQYKRWETIEHNMAQHVCFHHEPLFSLDEQSQYANGNNLFIFNWIAISLAADLWKCMICFIWILISFMHLTRKQIITGHIFVRQAQSKWIFYSCDLSSSQNMPLLVTLHNTIYRSMVAVWSIHAVAGCRGCSVLPKRIFTDT